MAAITGHIPSLRRQIKNVACNYSDAQVKVREATSNDPWGASSSLMSEIADMTYNALAFTEIMQIIWKRLNDSGKNWRHVYKSLSLLDYLIKVGSDKVAHQCRENIFAIQTLKDFQHIEDNKDQGINVREKAKQLVAMLKDDERLKNERAKALTAKKRFTQNGSGSSAEGSHHRRLDSCRSDNDLPSYESSKTGENFSALTFKSGGGKKARSSINLNSLTLPNGADKNKNGQNGSSAASEFEECRPRSAGEEEMQLQIALALSKEDAEKEHETAQSDDIRLQMALQESEKQPGKATHRQTAAPPGQSTSALKNPSSALDDLLSLQTAPVAPPSNYDPWGGEMSSSAAGADPWTNNYPNGVPVQQQSSSFDDPFMPKSEPSAASNDPWAAPNRDVAPAPTNGITAMTDPWGCDILAPAVIGQQSQQNGTAMLLSGEVATVTRNGTVEVAKLRNVKTPENFLGENSNLVNLDNLLSAPTNKNAFSGGKSGSSINNPFAAAVQASAAAPSAAPPNPFAAQQKRATPTLNEMRSGGACWPSSAASAAAAPPNPATNPFL